MSKIERRLGGEEKWARREEGFGRDGKDGGVDGREEGREEGRKRDFWAGEEFGDGEREREREGRIEGMLREPPDVEVFQEPLLGGGV